MRRHEIARIVEVSSSLFAPMEEAVMAADWLMSLFPGVLFLVAARGRGGLSIGGEQEERAIGARPEIPPPCLSRSPSAQILHKIPQILNIPDKHAANRRRIV